MENSPDSKKFLGQPIGLSTLFFTEMWERFSYYGMRAILLYYIYDEVANGGLGLPRATAASIMAIYGSLVYMSTIAGGWVSDRLLGARKTVFYGGVFIMLGHIILATPFGVPALFLSIAFIVVGTGLLKPNVSDMVGSLYEEDGKRDAGFSIFVMGINIGSLLAPIIVGTIGQTYNYHLGFSIAAVGMFLGLLQFFFQGRKALGDIGLAPTNPLNSDEKKKIGKTFGLVVLAILVVLGILQVLGHLNIDTVILIISIVGVCLPIYYFGTMLSSDRVTTQEKSHVRAYIPLFIGSIFFWSLEEQGSVVLAMFADKQTELQLFNWEIPSSLFQTLNPMFVILLTPFFALLWTKLGSRQPSTGIKFAVGIIFAGLSFVVMAIPMIIYGTDAKVSPLWLVLSFFLVIIGELCVSPVGLSITSRLAPKAFQSQMMGIWFLGDAAAQAVNSQIVKYYTPESSTTYFIVTGAITILVGFIMFFISPKIVRLMNGNND